MSDSNSMWPFQEISAEEGLDINEIFGAGTSNGAAAPEANPFQIPQQAVPAPETTTPHVEQPPTSPAAPQAEQTPAPQPAAVTIPPATIPAAEPVPSNPLEAAFEAKTVENAKASLFEKKPVFCHKSAKEVIEDPTMTFEELRIRKSEDFLDLEEGKNVSWSVEYGTIRKDVKDPKGTTIISMKESIERSREFLDALKKAKDKNPDCIVRPKVTMKNKGTAAYKGTFPTVEAARNSDMLSLLTLSAEHRENLRERGLSDDRIDQNQYRSMPQTPEGRKLLASLLRGTGHDLQGIPGFRTSYGEWTLSGPNGFLIPVRDKDGLIQGMKIRLDEGEPGRKYRWLSSRNAPNGTRSYSWTHVTGSTASKRAYITEGPLKGDVASYLDNDALFVCIGGVFALHGLKDTLISLGLTEVVEAMDMDQMTNPQVRRAIQAIRREVQSIRGIRYSKYVWNPAYKGIDDYYLSRIAAQ